ncbi:MAG: alpha/beta fold hydrolase [Lutibacter sp.]
MITSIKNTTIFYESYGKGAAVVLLHGFLESSNMWKNLIPILSKNFRVITIDLLGHGSSENKGYIHTMQDQAEIVKGVLNQLKLRKYVLIGHSMGGYVALSFAKLFQENVKGLCLLNSSALQDSKEKKQGRDQAIKLVKQNHQSFISLSIPMLFSLKNRLVFKEEIKQLISDAKKMNKQGIIAALEGMKIRENRTAIYQLNLFPILMIASKQDPALNFESLTNQIENTTVEMTVFPDGHMSYIENKNDVNNRLFEFVKTCFH